MSKITDFNHFSTHLFYTFSLALRRPDCEDGNAVLHHWGSEGHSQSARLLPTGRKNGYTLGGRQFIERFKVGLFVPMHFIASGLESAWRMKEFTEEKQIPFWEITKEGDSLSILPHPS